MIDETKLDAQGFYDGMRESTSLLVRRENLRSSEQFTELDRPVDALLAFGRAVQHTPHLIQEAALEAVARHFGPKYAAAVHQCDCGGAGCGGRAGESLRSRAGAVDR